MESKRSDLGCRDIHLVRNNIAVDVHGGAISATLAHWRYAFVPLLFVFLFSKRPSRRLTKSVELAPSVRWGILSETAIYRQLTHSVRHQQLTPIATAPY
jgi:hypothetical protein